MLGGINPIIIPHLLRDFNDGGTDGLCVGGGDGKSFPRGALQKVTGVFIMNIRISGGWVYRNRRDEGWSQVSDR